VLKEACLEEEEGDDSRPKFSGREFVGEAGWGWGVWSIEAGEVS
jgi:hypothetical protein